MMKNMKTFGSLALASFTLAMGVKVTADEVVQEPAAGPVTERVLTTEVEWGPLNPARGDKGPRAGTLWGDRTSSGPSGFLVKFAEGFSSPPHIHNVSYRGVVISGLVHNDDPNAAQMWLSTGSYWTQPAGEAHITSADGSSNLAYIEIEQGPYLVQPTEEAFDNGEKPVNVDTSNIVWLDALNSNCAVPSDAPACIHGAEIAFLWGSPQDQQLNGTLVKLPAGFSGDLRSDAATFRSVVIQGRAAYRAPGETETTPLAPGSYFGSSAASSHRVSCESGADCIFYVRTEGRYDVKPD